MGDGNNFQRTLGQPKNHGIPFRERLAVARSDDFMRWRGSLRIACDMNLEALEPLPLPALKHCSYCPRQCTLIHVEQVFEENLFTLRGQAPHKHVDNPGFEACEALRVERALPLFCDRLGLVGKADVVKFLPDGTP